MNGDVADVRPANENDNIAPLAAAHGRYEAHGTIFLSPGETKPTALVINKTITVVDGWIDDGIFIPPQIRVIEEARSLWRDIKRPTHDCFDSDDPEDRHDSFESERAKNLLRRCRRLVGDSRWGIFENVIRWNEPTGVPGSRIARSRSGSIAAAQAIVTDVADAIWRARIL